MIRDFLETLAWLVIVAAFICSESRRYRQQVRDFRRQGKQPPPFQW